MQAQASLLRVQRVASAAVPYAPAFSVPVTSDTAVPEASQSSLRVDSDQSQMVLIRCVHEVHACFCVQLCAERAVC